MTANQKATGARWLRDSRPNEHDERTIARLRELLRQSVIDDDGRVVSTRSRESQ